MADFLTRIAERTLGTAPTVQAIIAPMFAPDPTLNGAWSPNVAGDHSTDSAQFSTSSAQDGESVQALDVGQMMPAREKRGTHHQRGSILSPPTRQQAAPSLTPLLEERNTQSHTGETGQHHSATSPAPLAHISTQVTGESRTELPMERTVTEHEIAKQQHVLDSIDAENTLHDRFIEPRNSSSTPVKLVSSTSGVVIHSTQSLMTQGEQGAKPESSSAAKVALSIQSLVPQEGRRTTNVGAQLIAPSTPPPLIGEPVSPRTSMNSPLKAINNHVAMTSSQAVAATTPANASTISTPTIKVTIGRIEVRATAPAPAPVSAPRPRPARPGPAISLNDYLKQYNGRHR